VSAPPGMGKRRQLLVLTLWMLGFTLLAILHHNLVGEGGQVSGWRLGTSHDRGPIGSKVYFLLLKELKLNVGRWEKPPAQLPDDGSLLVVLSPRSAPGEEAGRAQAGRAEVGEAVPDEVKPDTDLADLRQWVMEGGRLLVADDQDDRFMRNLGLVVESGGGIPAIMPIPAGAAENRGVNRIQVSSPARLKSIPPDSTILAADRHGPILVHYGLGDGEVWVTTAWQLFDNQEIALEDNAVLAANLAAIGSGGAPVLIDEYFHGLVKRPGMLASLGLPARLALVQAALALLLLLWSRGARFGSPRQMEVEQADSGMEYVSSLAGLYQRAAAGRLALETLYRGFLIRTARALGIPPGSEPERIARLLEQKRAKLKEPFLNLVLDCRRQLAGQAVSDGLVLSLAARMDRIRKELASIERGK